MNHQIASGRARLGLRLALPFIALAMILGNGCGCDPDDVSRITYDLEVTPNPIEFEVTAARETAEITVRLRNMGVGRVELGGDPTLIEHDAGDHALLSLRDDDGEVLRAVRCNDTSEVIETSNVYSMQPGDCRAVTVVYAPREVGTVTGELHIASNDAGDLQTGGVRVVPIEAPSDASNIEICLPVSGCTDAEICIDDLEEGEVLELVYPLTQLGETRSCPVRVTNHGLLPLRSLNWAFSVGNRFADFSLEPTDITDLEILTGEGVEMEVKFHPATGGERTATITLSSNDPLRPQARINVFGLGDGPRICPDPMPVASFGEVDVGTTVEQDVVLESCGTQPLEITDLWITDATGQGTSDSYEFGAGVTKSLVLEPGDDLDVPVHFTPRVVGQVNGRLYFTTNDPAAPQGFVSLTGVGLIPPSCEITPSTSEVNFGSAAVGYEPTRRTLSLTNTGQLPCSDVEATITQGMAAKFEHIQPSAGSQPFYLEPGDTEIINLQYEPEQGIGISQTGELTISSPNLERSVLVALSGQSVAEPTCNLSITPARQSVLADECMAMGSIRPLQFGALRLNQTSTMAITLENVGSADCDIKSTKMSNPMPFSPLEGYAWVTPRNNVEVNGSITNKIKPGEIGEIKIEFSPNKAYTFCGQVTIETNDPGPGEGICSDMPIPGFPGMPGPAGEPGCYAVGLRGAGVRATVAAVPGEMDFGYILIDCVSPDREINLYNTGGAVVTLEAPQLTPAGGPFSLRGAVPPAGHELQPGTKVTYRVRYYPEEGPTSHSGTLTIPSDAENSPTVVPLMGKSTDDPFQVDLFEQLSEPMVDVLWVIDDSCSMGDVQTNLRNNIQGFMNRAVAQETDFQMGVITTDWDDQDKAGKLQGNPRIIDRSTPDPVQAFRDNANVGTSGHHIEKGFDPTIWALTDPLASGHNAGFLREDAKLVIIFVSDEEEQSDSSVDFFVDFMRNLKGYRNDALVDAHAIVGDPGVDGHKRGCGDSSGQDGSAGAAPRYYEASKALGGRFYSICSPDWGKMADEIGLDAFAARREFFLSREPIPETLVVEVNGQRVHTPADWSYDPTTNSIVFTTGSVPDQGAKIRVSYEALCRSP